MQKLSPSISHTNENGAGHKKQSHRQTASVTKYQIKFELSFNKPMKEKSVAWSWSTEGALGLYPHQMPINNAVHYQCSNGNHAVWYLSEIAEEDSKSVKPTEKSWV